MWFIDITVSKQGTDTLGVESVLLEMYERYERSEVEVVEKPLHSLTGSAFQAYRYRVHLPTALPPGGAIEQLVERLKVRTRSDVHITHPQSFAIFGVDGKRGKD